MELGAWLETNGLGKYADVFAENEIDFDVLPQLTEDDLEKLELSVGARRRLSLAVQSLDATAASRAAEPLADSLQAERRQLTVMFCDMVGFTELASRVDPEVLHNIIRIYEDNCAAAITRYEGYVFQRLGDGIVAFFGYPLAHEGEAERAIRAGLDIIEALSILDVPEITHLSVRIGIATGVVVVASAEKGAVGDTMNLASRLQGIAPVDSIVVSERVRQLASGAFDYEDLGEQQLKGIVRSTRAYRIAGVSEAVSRFEAASGEKLTPLVGRDLELGLLMDRWALAQDGEGQVVLLSGEPGIGKSRILDALRERLEAQEVKSLRFQCSPYYVNSAFWPSIANFERALKFKRDETPDSKLNKLESLIVGHYQRPLSDVRFIASMLSIPCDDRYGGDNMTPQKCKDETLRTLVDLSESAARKQSCVMLYEDVHWADPTTLEVLDLLVGRVKDIPLLVVLTHRPEFHIRWAQHGHVSALDLSKLTRTQSRTMVSSLSGGKSLPDDLLAQIVAKTDGVPLFVEELTKSLMETGQLTEVGNRFEYADTAHAITVPETLRDLLTARLDRSAPVKEIAQIGAAIGREFRYELIAAVAPFGKAQLDDSLTQLTDSGLAFRRGTPPEAVYIFKHALVQDAAYDSLLKSKRQELHSKIARAIEERFQDIRDNEPEVLAQHLTEARLIEQAVDCWLRTAQRAIGRSALPEAIVHLNKGLNLVLDLPDSVERIESELALRTALGTAWVGFKGWGAPEIWTSLHPALALAKSLGHKNALLIIYWGLVQYIYCVGRVADSIPWAKEMLEEAESSGDDAFLVQAHLATSISYYWMGKLVEAMGHAEKVFALYDEEKHRYLVNLLNNDPMTAAQAYASQTTWKLGYPDRALRLSDEALERSRRLGHLFDLGYALTIGADVFDFRGEPDELRRRAEESYALGRESNLPLLSEYLAQSRIGISLIREGKGAEGIVFLKAALVFWEKTGGKIRTPYLKAVLAEGIAKLGEHDDALKLLEEQIEEVERPDREERPDYAEMLRLKGWILSLEGDLAGAEKAYLASLEFAREQQAKSWELRTSTSLARLWQQQGKCKEAHELLAPVYNWFTEGFDTKDLKEAKALLQELEVAA